MTVAELAEIVSRKVSLKRVGKTEWVGRCPFHQPDNHPSFTVYEGRDGTGQVHCHSCQAGGSAAWWMRRIEGQKGGLSKPDPEIRRQRAEAYWRAARLSEWRDRNVDSPIPDFAVDVGEPPKTRLSR
jgi:hypothetical protein